MGSPVTVDVTLGCRQATTEDALLLWRWANDPETRRNSLTKQAIPLDEHEAWLAQRLTSPSTRFWIFSDAEGPVGQVRCELEGETAEVHLSVAPERRGRGLGAAMLGRAVALVGKIHEVPVKIRARVLETNARSLALFEACGFGPVGATESPEGERAIIFEMRLP
jgi:UDP-2,4-diacetamido-2,4,6-trideoxy-beta-L-altropyranose hydrolase